MPFPTESLALEALTSGQRTSFLNAIGLGATDPVTHGEFVCSGLTLSTAYERHVQISAKANGSPATQPESVAFESAGGLRFSASATKYAYLQFEVPDDWDGTDMYLEIDWFPDSGAMSGTDTIEWVIDYRSVAVGDSILNGTMKTLAISDSADYTQYKTKHTRFTLPFNDAAQPLVKQDHVYVRISRNVSATNDFAGTVTAAGYELIYQSVGIPTT